MPTRLAWPLTLFAVFVLIFGLIASVRAHDHGFGSWIGKEKITDPVSNIWCCNENDCFEETDNVEPVSGGYLIKSTGELIEAKRVIWRSPGGWWRCRNLANNSTRCLIGPPQGS